MKKKCSRCNNNKGEITKEYCLSNPLHPDHEEEPLYEHYGHWNISQWRNCKDFSKENNIIIEDEK